MGNKGIAVVAHLMRRAGFGAPYNALEAHVAKGYEATVEELLDPDAYGVPEFDEFSPARFYPGYEWTTTSLLAQNNVTIHIVSSPRPLVEKMALFWHMLFATSNTKVMNSQQMLLQFNMVRNYGMGNYKELLTNMAKDPAMVFWLDNNENHKYAPNENWGRELLELFSMGQGNYTEDDVKVAACAFTGWTFSPKVPYTGKAHAATFEYKEEDHDDGEKVFLGQSGRLNGEDIIDIIVQQPATHRFIARHLYNFFVSDEVQVPSWHDEPPKDPQAVQAIADVFRDSRYEIRDTLRFIFNSDFFKDEETWFTKVKSPAEVVAGTMRLIGDFKEPKPGVALLSLETGYQGQVLLNPPSVEGWHTGHEWIDSGSLVRRINFMSEKVSNPGMPGVRYIIDRLAAKGRFSAEELVDNCLELLGCARLEPETRQAYIEHAEAGGEIGEPGTSEVEREAFERQCTEILRLIGASKEYQFC